MDWLNLSKRKFTFEVHHGQFRKREKQDLNFKRPNNVKVILVNATISIKMISDETKKNRVIIIEDLKILEEDFLTMLMMS